MTDIAAEAGAPNTTSASEPTPKVHPWTDTQPHPWRRFFARIFDSLLFGALGLSIIAAVMAIAAPDTLQAATAFSETWVGQFVTEAVLLLVAAPFMALSTAWTGGTPGKWLTGVRVTRLDGRRIGLWEALVREFKVALIGRGLGLPIVSLFTTYAGKERLEEDGSTPWDADRFRVTHRAESWLQKVMTTVAALAWISTIVFGVIDRVASIANG